ncbi:MAG: hypothetical protein OEZ10_13640 [Gammaproteobacteria bacterium]|nr:hypothetical protein [Gammaproteobacteria bacterium]
MRIGIFVSGLIVGTTTAETDDSALSALLSRADISGARLPDTAESALLSAIGLGKAGAGPCRALALNQVDSEAGCFCLDPVHLAPSLDKLVLDHPGRLQLSRAEAEMLVNELNTYFSQDSVHIQILDAGRWLLTTPGRQHISTVPTEQAMGVDTLAFMPTGPDALYWHKLITEMQTVMHMSPVNQQREDIGLNPANSVWLWGEGERPDVSGIPWQRFFSEDDSIRGIGKSAAIPVSGLPSSWTDCRDASEHNSFVVLSPDLIQAHFGPMDGIRNYRQVILDNWILPILKDIKTGHIQSLAIYTEAVQPVHFSRTSLKRWWRRKRPLHSYWQRSDDRKAGA